MRDPIRRAGFIRSHVQTHYAHLDPAALRAQLRKIVRDDAELKAVTARR